MSSLTRFWRWLGWWLLGRPDLWSVELRDPSRRSFLGRWLAERARLARVARNERWKRIQDAAHALAEADGKAMGARWAAYGEHLSKLPAEQRYGSAAELVTFYEMAKRGVTHVRFVDGMIVEVPPEDSGLVTFAGDIAEMYSSGQAKEEQ